MRLKHGAGGSLAGEVLAWHSLQVTSLQVTLEIPQTSIPRRGGREVMPFVQRDEMIVERLDVRVIHERER